MNTETYINVLRWAVAGYGILFIAASTLAIIFYCKWVNLRDGWEGGEDK